LELQQEQEPQKQNVMGMPIRSIRSFDTSATRSLWISFAIVAALGAGAVSVAGASRNPVAVEEGEGEGAAEGAAPGEGEARGPSWKEWREAHLRQLRQRHQDAAKFSKLSEDTLAEFRASVAAATSSTVILLNGDDQVALGVAVHADGYILTKASEVAKVPDGKLRCQFPGGITVACTGVTDMFLPYDIALVKTAATGLHPVAWKPEFAAEPGRLLAASGIGPDPISVGVVSVITRSLNPGFLGVKLRNTNGGDVAVAAIVKSSGAAAAGLQENDVILRLEDEEIESVEKFIARVQAFHPGDEIRLRVKRGETELTLRATLGPRRNFVPLFDPNAGMLRQMGVPLSANRSGYPQALQHDMALLPNQCGGPLVDLDGNVVGINIARAGRIQTLAITAADLAPLLETVADGRFSIPSIPALEEALGEARQTVSDARAALAEAERREAAARHNLETARQFEFEAVVPDETADIEPDANPEDPEDPESSDGEDGEEAPE